MNIIEVWIFFVVHDMGIKFFSVLTVVEINRIINKITQFTGGFDYLYNFLFVLVAEENFLLFSFLLQRKINFIILALCFKQLCNFYFII